MVSFIKPMTASALAAVVISVALGSSAGLAQRRPPAAQTGGARVESQAAASDAYVGEQACLGCHAGQAKGYRGSAHGRASALSSPMATRGCESCHGPGRAHADSGGDKSKIKTFTVATPAHLVDAQCLHCHDEGDRALWNGSKHDEARISCVGCHSIHAPATDDKLLKRREVENCSQCHKSEVQKLRRSSHMPLDEGALECSSCHNPHGTAGVKLLKKGATVNETCERCHADKRGPHLWEHAPVVESCTTCHDPHGSTNDRMLVAKEPFLCQRCHVSSQHPSSTYDLYALTNTTTANRMSGRSCAACHQNIHGSNAPSGRAFLR
jgi:DmsE family decaheme c-type cytochrome